MFVRDLSACNEFVAGDKSLLKVLLNPWQDNIEVKYSMAHATVKPGQTTLKHVLKSSEVYYILKGKGIMHIGEESQAVREGQLVYIPPGSMQCITNTEKEDLVFLCIVDPAWKQEDEEIGKT